MSLCILSSLQPLSVCSSTDNAGSPHLCPCWLTAPQHLTLGDVHPVPHASTCCGRATCSPSEFEGLVQRNLAASCSLSYHDFAAFIMFMVDRALHELDACTRKGAAERRGGDLGEPSVHRSQSQQAGSTSRGMINGIQAGDGRQSKDSRACCFHKRAERQASVDGAGAVMAVQEPAGSLGVPVMEGHGARSTEALRHCLSLQRLWLVGSKLLAEMTVLATECRHTQADLQYVSKVSVEVADADAVESSQAPEARPPWVQEQLEDFAQALMAAQKAVHAVLQSCPDCFDICWSEHLFPVGTK